MIPVFFLYFKIKISVNVIYIPNTVNEQIGEVIRETIFILQSYCWGSEYIDFRPCWECPGYDTSDEEAPRSILTQSGSIC